MVMISKPIVGIIGAILVIAVIAGVMLIHSQSPSNDQSSASQVTYKVLGTIYVYNVSYLSNYFMNPNVTKYINTFGSGVFYAISVNQSKGVMGYIQVKGPLASMIFQYINKTLVRHGFQQGSYGSLIYDYKTKTAVGFDGRYIYVVHTNSTNSTINVNLLISLYNSNKQLPTTTEKGLIISGNLPKLNFTGKLVNNQVILNFNYTGNNFDKLTKLLKRFLFETDNLTITGNFVYKNSTFVIYSLNVNNTTYALLGAEDHNDMITGVIIVSNSSVSVNEIYSYL
ncbi:hypothetical protein ATY89_04790 [Sulfolobus acidocaldarius]|uniref:Conserved protein n=5 Tax=Sulfolobus acidocaldarius TaxID=2285 RepID=Q4JBW5_SULAC|nr:conserved protein [Sulfolobus acidocaldarius DSM 639]AGE70273.1 hypothetical protein SacN8_01460 [Sulfolobus acidocaldarius N8]AGE72548.1 hypothetical protein SacRon12I_01460 [Sulfolobus acidocaldarius Ron12/I]ALU29325.1 hypothetical protein ATY89_04790 [Sulfolobus acidocaldarius]ALU32054.1 hypothetical protein ATZ20_07815 [Sulfolobus acidocaldarius]